MFSLSCRLVSVFFTSETIEPRAACSEGLESGLGVDEERSEGREVLKWLM